jgi:hypothetical protein
MSSHLQSTDFVCLTVTCVLESTLLRPIMVPRRKPLVTLRDAAHYITKLPKIEHDAKEWQAAMQALLLVAERDGDPMFARISISRRRHLFVAGSARRTTRSFDKKSRRF